MAQAMTERCYRTESLPQGIGVYRRALTRRRRYAAAHLSVTPFGRATSPQGEA